MTLEGIVGALDKAAQAAAFAANKPTRKQTMDAELFMKLMVEQLKYQDPTSPMDSNAMIAQTTQLAMMQQITDNTTTGHKNFALQMRIAAANLVGKQVSCTDADTGKTVTGTATGVSYAKSVPTVTVDGKDINLNIVSGVKTPA